MALDELKGTDLGVQRVVIERAPVPVFARSLGEDPGAFAGDDAEVPPTFPFAMAYWGTIDGEVQGLPIPTLRKRGMILHGEQEFVYSRWPRVGDLLEGHRTISDVYEKDTSSARRQATRNGYGATAPSYPRWTRSTGWISKWRCVTPPSASPEFPTNPSTSPAFTLLPATASGEYALRWA